ncbi:substrate-binding domain-containing protein [Kribbella sp. NPDC054772]
MQAAERHQAILERVEARGSMKVQELADELGVAAVTVRVDVRELARRGLVERVHGGVTWPLGESARPTPERAEARAGKRYGIGMVVPHPSYYYPEVISGARQAADELGVQLTLTVSGNDQAEERAQVEQLLASGADGLVLTTTLDPRTSAETESWLRSLPVPVVLAERRVGLDTGTVEHVATDHEHGAHLAVRHLADLGYRRIGLLHFDTVTAPMLRAGYEWSLAGLGLERSAPEISMGENAAPQQDAVSRQLVDAVRAGKVDAILVHNDSLALPLVGRLKAAGVAVPGDLAVVAYDDQLAALCDPPLTAVAPPRAAVGAEALRLLVARLDDPTRPLHRLLLQPDLRIRRSDA